ncbi:MAG: DNA polymerase III subunit alpha [bacterium]
MDFIHLHAHTEYSILDSIIKTKQLIGKAKELGQEAVALTDHGNMFGLYEYWKECHEQGMKPILGCEFNVAVKSRFDKKPTEKSNSLVLIAKNFHGYQNLIRLVSIGYLEGFYYKPRIDKECIEKYSEDLIALSGHEYSEIRQHFILGDEDKAEAAAKWYKEIFKENYYIELARVGNEHEEELNEKILNVARKLDIPIVATGDIHYLLEEDYSPREIAWAIGDGKKLADPSRRQDKNHQYYFKSTEEMVELWKDLPEAIENTKKICDQIEDFKITYGIVQPKYNKIPDEMDRELLVRKLAYEGADKLYGDITPQIKERLEYELEILHDKGFDEYLLVVQDYANEARRRGIAISARGSVVGSVAVYCLGITNTDPLWWNLPFERFLNKERNSFPDIDMDFQDDRRNEMFDYVREVYGAECCSNVVTFGKLTTKAAIRDVGRVMGIPLSTCDKLSKMVTVKFGRVTKIKEMMNKENFPEFVEIVNSSEDLQTMIKYVQKIEGLVRNTGMHACGFLITPKPIYEYIPVCFEKEGRTMMTQIVGQKLEDLGLMKFDFLGVANLSAVGQAIRFIKQYRNLDLDLQTIPIDDAKTFKKIFQAADTNAVFQLESGGMKKYLKEMKPTNIKDIAALIALYRPGPIANIPEYIGCKNGTQEVSYLIPESKEVLEESFGVMVYQDQAMLMAIKAAGYSWAEADGLRKAMGKKIPELMIEQEKKFIAGIVAKGYSEEIANKLFEQVKPFADYGFNKAHTAAYATLTYWTAYLKANYTIEFIAALMQCDIEKADKLTRDIIEAQEHGIEVMPPDINKSHVEFSIEEPAHEDGDGGKIRFGLGGMKSVGLNQVDEIVKTRGDKPYSSLEDLLSRVDLKKVSKNAIEVLIKVGAMDSFGRRSQLLEVYEKIYESTQKLVKSSLSASLMMFGEEEVKQLDPIKFSDIHEVSASDKVDWEKEYLGVYFSVHPLQKAMKILKKADVKTIDEMMKDVRTGSKAKIAATIKQLRCVYTKKDNKKMCFGKLEDADSVLNFTVFPSIFEKFGDKIIEGKSYIIVGKKDKRDEEYGIVVDTVEELDFSKYLNIDDEDIAEEPIHDELKPKNVYTAAPSKPKAVGEKKSVYDKVSPAVVPVQHRPSFPQYSKIKIIIKDGTDRSLLMKLNQYLAANSGNVEISIALKAGDSSEKVMVLNNKLNIGEKTSSEIKAIISTADVLFS